MKLSLPHIYRTWRSSISPELINVTQVLLELVTVREGGLCFSEFDDVSIRQFIECICFYRDFMRFLSDSLLFIMYVY